MYRYLCFTSLRQIEARGPPNISYIPIHPPILQRVLPKRTRDSCLSPSPDRFIQLIQHPARHLVIHTRIRDAHPVLELAGAAL